MESGPDQGFAWVIAVACFFINFLMAGLARSAAVLYVAIINVYGVSRETATTPFSIRVCVRNITGPLVGLLGEKYGIRGVTTIGGVVAALGSILCYFAPNVFWITMFWGAIHGLGFGLSTVIHMIAINQYFDKYKASALGLGYSGDCFGTFTFPVIMEYLICTYGLRGTFLIIGGMVLNVIPMALLLRKPPWLKNTNKPVKPKRISTRKKLDHPKLKTHNNSIFIQRNRMLKIHTHSGCLSTVRENEGPADDCQNNENFENGRHLVTFGGDLKGHYNKGFESSKSDLNLVGKCSEGQISTEIKTADKLKSLKPSPQMHLLVPGSSNSIHRSENLNVNDSKNFLKPEDFRGSSQIRTSRSVTDLNRRNESFCNGSKSPRLGLSRILDLQEQRRDSLPLVFAKEKFLNDKNEKLQSFENVKNEKSLSSENVEHEITQDNEMPLALGVTGIMKKRTSSFVGQVAQDIVNRMRTASFASQAAQDGFIATIGQESESESETEPEMECQLKSIVAHKNHDAEHCTHQDIILSIDRNMVDDYFKDILERPEKDIEEKPKPPSMYKLLLRTNTKPMFILISISLAVYAFMFVSNMTIIIDYATDLGIEEDRAKYLIVGFSVADLFGRLSFGQVIDRNLMKMKNYAGVTLFLMGALVAVVPLNTSFNYIMVCMCMYGVVQGGAAIMFPILINLYMDKNLESVAMGSLNLYGGILMLLMAPMIGFFRDNTGSYNSVFYVTGGVVVVVGILWQFEPLIIKFQNKKLHEKYIMREMNLQQIAE